MDIFTRSLRSIANLLYRVTALVTARISGRDIRVTLRRLEALPRTRAALEVGAVTSGLFLLALLAASFGVWGLLAYFAAILILFR